MHDNGNTGTGGDLVSVATSTINITAVNDAPVATITPASYANTEQVALNLKNNGLSISDVDAGSGSMSVTLAVTEGTLNVAAGSSGAVVTNSGTSSVTITGTVAQVNALLELQCHQQRQLRRQHRYPERLLDADADGARQRQHRHRRRPGLGCDLHHQHHGGERRAGGDDHAGELRGDRADEPHAQGHRAVDQRRGCRLRLHERDAGGHRGHAQCGRRHQRRGRHQLRHLLGHHHRHGGADQQPADQQCHEHGQLHRQHRYPERLLDADADGARQRQHRHRRRPGLGCDLHHQHHGCERRPGGDHHAGRATPIRSRWRSTSRTTGCRSRMWMPDLAP